ncbi:MAG TPA: hypothetical protein VNO26_13030 [Candidatus Limnocylindria bacterium]|nr:hypothetical protein [Candidatus Limnocylindria bacterium]
MRLIPLAPFGVVNLVAGLAHLGVRPFALGGARWWWCWGSWAWPGWRACRGERPTEALL